MKANVPFNINEMVRVRLTDFGREIHKQQYETIFRDHLDDLPYESIVEDPNGWSEWQLWDLMRTYGPYMSMGSPKLVFETNIEILVPI